MLMSTPHMRTGSITKIMNNLLHQIAFILIAHTTSRIAGQLMASKAEACPDPVVPQPSNPKLILQFLQLQPQRTMVSPMYNRHHYPFNPWQTRS